MQGVTGSKNSFRAISGRSLDIPGIVQDTRIVRKTMKTNIGCLGFESLHSFLNIILGLNTKSDFARLDNHYILTITFQSNDLMIVTNQSTLCIILVIA